MLLSLLLVLFFARVLIAVVLVISVVFHGVVNLVVNVFVFEVNSTARDAVCCAAANVRAAVATVTAVALHLVAYQAIQLVLDVLLVRGYHRAATAA